MKDVLEEIVAHKRVELEQFKRSVPPSMLYDAVEKIVDQPVASMRKSLMESESGIIAEFKRKSPSKGWIKEQGRAEDIPGLSAAWSCGFEYPHRRGVFRWL